MKLQFTLAFLLLAASEIILGQSKLSTDFTVSTGIPYQVVDARIKEYFNDGSNQIITVKSSDDLVTVQRFDLESMKETSRMEYEDFPDDSETEKILKVGNNMYYIYSSTKKKEDNFTVAMRKLNMTSGTLGAPVDLFKTGGDICEGPITEVPAYMGMQRDPSMKVITSYDQSKVLITYRREPLSRKDEINYDIVGFYVFDADMNKLWGEEVTMPHTEEQMNNLAYSITNDGTAHVLSYLNETKEFELINVRGGEALETHRLDVDGDLTFQSFYIEEDASGNLICSGYYATGYEFKMNWSGGMAIAFNANGIVHFKMNTEGKMLETHNYEFPIELINQYESERAKEKAEEREAEGKAGVMDLKMRDVVVNPDGSTVFVGEQFYMRNEYAFNKNRLAYHYADVVITKVDKTGKLLWMKKLPKSQKGYSGRGGMGIRYIQGTDAGYVLYLDNVKNASISIDDVPEGHLDGRGGFLSAYKVANATGEISKHTLFDITDVKGTECYQFNTTRIFDGGGNKFLLEVYIKDKQDMLIKMELDK